MEVLSDLERAEINFVCLENCIDLVGGVDQCFKGCVPYMEALYLDKMVEEVLFGEYVIRHEPNHGINKIIYIMIIGLILILLTLYLACTRRMKEKLKDDEYKKMRRSYKKRNPSLEWGRRAYSETYRSSEKNANRALLLDP